MSLHGALPLAAFLLNASLVAIALLRDPGARVNRLFASLAAAMAVWNVGVFMLRQAPDPPRALFWEVVIHAGVIALPALYYHFVLVFLAETDRHRRPLRVAYAVSAAFTLVNLSGSALFMRGVKWTFWGWAPAPGPLYPLFVLYFNAILVYGLSHLVRAHGAETSSFRRNRTLLMILGTLVSLTGGFVDFARFIVARFVPAADQAYPIGIPANMVFALTLGTSIVRYRLFDVGVAVKKALIYGIACAALASALFAVIRAAAGPLGWRGVDTLWIVVPLALLITLLLGPPGRRLDAAVERLMLGNRRGCYESLLALSQRMSAILDFDRLVDTLVTGLARGIPVTHCALLVRGPDADSFTVGRQEVIAGEGAGALPADSALVRWLAAGKVLVTEEARVNRELARQVEGREGELDRLGAAVLVPLRVEQELSGILLAGEKLSGEIFDAQELELLGLLANQAATALENARLYRTLQEAYDELTNTQAQLTQAQKMEAVGRLAGGIAHDFNNLLTVIQGRGELLLVRLGPESALRRDVELILRTAERAASLTQQLLAFSRRQVLQPRVLDLNTVVANMAPMLQTLLGEDIELTTSLDPALGRVRADPGHLEQVIMNLSVNARDAMERGGRLTIATGNVDADRSRADPRARLEPGSYVMLAVSDTGRGMDEETRAQIFEPFFTTKGPGRGTGLGLSTVYGIVIQSGGRIAVDSALGLGTTLRIYLPRVDGPAEAVAPEPGPSASGPVNETILLVDDEADLRALAAEILEAQGYLVLQAGEGEEAVRVSARHGAPIHLLVTDMVMPQMNGRELARRLAESRPGMKVLYMSGYTDEGVALGGELGPGGAFLQKPFAPDALLRKVRETLRQAAEDAPGP